MKNTEEKLITYEWGRAGVAGAREEGSLAQEWSRNGVENGEERERTACSHVIFTAASCSSPPASSSLSFEYSCIFTTELGLVSSGTFSFPSFHKL